MINEPRQIAKLRDAEQHKQDVFVKWLMGPDADEALKLLCEEFADRTSFVPGDPYSTAFKEGQRNVVLFLLDVKENLNG